jgi:fibronectin-binding autotransporter adhesin
MSEIRVNNIKNEAGTGAPTFPNGATVLGTLTGTATTAQGLTGSPSITVTNVSAQDVQVGGALTVTGNLTVNGTQTIINTTNLEITDPLVGIGSGNTTDAQANGDGIQIYGATNKTFTYNDTKKSFEANIPIATNENRFITGAEKTVLISGNTASLTYNSSSANVAICTNATGNITLNVVGIPTSSDFDNHAITFTVIATSTSGVARTCTAVNLNGVPETIRWAGGSLANAISGLTTTSGYTIYGFTGINTVGSASTTANYEVFGVASGGFF